MRDNLACKEGSLSPPPILYVCPPVSQILMLSSIGATLKSGGLLNNCGPPRLQFSKSPIFSPKISRKKFLQKTIPKRPKIFWGKQFGKLIRPFSKKFLTCPRFFEGKTLSLHPIPLKDRNVKRLLKSSFFIRILLLTITFFFEFKFFFTFKINFKSVYINLTHINFFFNCSVRSHIHFKTGV